MLVADGLGGNLYNSHSPVYPIDLNFQYPWATVYNLTAKPPVTLADAFMQDGLAGDRANFDLIRHHGKINIAFCDGHVETCNITNSTGTASPDLQSVFLLAP